MDKNHSIKQKMHAALTKAGILLTAAWYGNVNVFCEDAGGGGGDGPFGVAAKAVDNVREGVVKVGKALFPVSIIIIVVSLFITHDERKLQMEIKIGIALCVAYILLIMFQDGGGTIATWLEGLAG